MNINLKQKSKITEAEKQEILEYEYLVKKLSENFENLIAEREEELRNCCFSKSGHPAEE